MAASPASVSGLALRASKLAVSGAPLAGVDTAYVTSKFMTLGFTPEYTEGDEVEEKAADGSVCVYFKLPDILKRVTFTLTICAPSPELTEILVGGTLLDDGGSPPDIVGYASPLTGVESTPFGISLEVWSRAVEGGRLADPNPYWWWVFPSVQMRLSGERVLENGMLANTFEGWGVGNENFADGPGDDWPYTSASPFQYARTATFPSGVEDYITVGS
jgi:hypothetical protein